jgi:DNA-directed RNA polymerase specialized sigma subunit
MKASDKGPSYYYWCSCIKDSSLFNKNGLHPSGRRLTKKEVYLLAINEEFRKELKAVKLRLQDLEKMVIKTRLNDEKSLWKIPLL